MIASGCLVSKILPYALIVFDFCFQLVEEYLRGPNYKMVPQTFQMDRLLDEMNRIGQHIDKNHIAPAYQGNCEIHDH